MTIRFFLSPITTVIVPDVEFGSIERRMPSMCVERAIPLPPPSVETTMGYPYPILQWSAIYFDNDALVRVEFPDGDVTVIQEAIEVTDWDAFRDTHGSKKYWGDQP